MPEEADQRRPAPPLPGEIWTMIASHISTKDWVKASGTCRSTRDVQPSSISLAPSQIGAFQWLVKHWQEVVSLSLDMRSTEPLGIADCALIIMMGCSSMQRLKNLKLSAPVPMEDAQCEEARTLGRERHGTVYPFPCVACWELQRKQKDEWAPWLALFSQQAGRLERLSLRVRAFAVPLAKTIKHLVLNVREDICRKGCEHLHQLPVLETLSIMHGDWGHADDWVYDFVIASRQTPCRNTDPLDLSRCTLLRAVRFDMVLPSEILVPRGCNVSARCDSAAFCYDWDHMPSLLCGGGCPKWHVEELECDEYNTAGELAEVLASDDADMAISSLCLECINFGSAKYPFKMGSCLGHLTDLEVHSDKDVRIGIFEGLRLKRFHVLAASVSLSVPDLADFAAHIQDLYFVGDFTCAVTTAISNEHLHVKMRVFPELGGRTEVRYPPGSDWVQPAEDVCKCGACDTCLGFEEIFV